MWGVVSRVSPGADVVRGEPSPDADVGGVSPVLVQMWGVVSSVSPGADAGRGEPSPDADGGGIGEPSPGAEVEGVSPSFGANEPRAWGGAGA